MLAACAALAIHLNGLSHHPGTDEYNERNWGAGLSCDSTEWARWSADVYKDSNSDMAAQVMREWDLARFGAVTAGVGAGVMHRRDVQERTGLPVFPAVLPYVRVEAGRLQAVVIPTPEVIGVQLRIAL